MRSKKNMAVTPMSDKEWMAKDDARTLARADEIKNDPARMKSAVKAAKSMAAEEMKEAKSMERIANALNKKKK